MGGTKGMLKDFERYPKYYDAYLRSFARMQEARTQAGLENRFKSAGEVMEWWIYGAKETNDNQLTIEEYFND